MHALWAKGRVVWGEGKATAEGECKSQLGNQSIQDTASTGCVCVCVFEKEGQCCAVAVSLGLGEG